MLEIQTDQNDAKIYAMVRENWGVLHLIILKKSIYYVAKANKYITNCIAAKEENSWYICSSISDEEKYEVGKKWSQNFDAVKQYQKIF